MGENQPCLTINALAIPGPQNPLPKHIEKILLKFDPNTDILPEHLMKKLIFSLKLVNVQHEDVVCRLFYFTFQGKASSWFFSLAPRSITSWKQFETTFMTQFNDDKTLGILFLYISMININKKEKVKDFNHIFITLLNRIPDKLAEAVQIEFCIVALPPPVAMFVKRKEKKNFGGEFYGIYQSLEEPSSNFSSSVK